MNKVFKNKYMLVGLLLILIIGVSGTYALWRWTNTEDETEVSMVVTAPEVIYLDDQTISPSSFQPVYTKEEGIRKRVRVRLTRAALNEVTITFKLKLDIFPIELKHETFKWELRKNDVLVSSGNFESNNEGDEVVLNSMPQIVTTTEDNYDLYIWIDGNYPNPASMSNKNFKFTLTGYGTNAVVRSIEVPSSCFTYTEGATITITDYKCFPGNTYSLPAITDVMIPAKINGKNVTIIGVSAFSNKQLTSVIIPNTVIEIKSEAFAFNTLTNISIPTSVTNIEHRAFKRNDLLEEQAYIYKRNSDGSIDYTKIVDYGGTNKNIVIPAGVEVIGNYAFEGLSIESVLIPEVVTTIGDTAFHINKLTSLILPTTLTSVGARAFNFENIVNGVSGYNFASGTVDNVYGNVYITN